jgi:hypothetical protein
MYQFEYELSEQDFLDFLTYYYQRTKSFLQQLLLLKITLFVLYASAIILFIHFLQDFFAIVPILIILYFSYRQFKTLPETLLKSYRKSAMKLIDGDKAKKTLGHKKFTMKDSVIVYEEAFSSSSLQIDDIHKIGETGTSIFIFVDEISAIVLPKRVFPNEQEMREFRDKITR